MRGAIAEGVGEFEHDPSGGIDCETLQGDGRACDVTGEALELVALNGRARDGRVEREALQGWRIVVLTGLFPGHVWYGFSA